MMRWPTPKDAGSPNAATNKFLSMCSKIVVSCPGHNTFKAELLGWDAYSLILRREDGRVIMLVKAQGLIIYPEEGFQKERDKNGQRDGQVEKQNADH